MGDGVASRGDPANTRRPVTQEELLCYMRHRRECDENESKFGVGRGESDTTYGTEVATKVDWQPFEARIRAGAWSPRAGNHRSGGSEFGQRQVASPLTEAAARRGVQ